MAKSKQTQVVLREEGRKRLERIKSDPHLIHGGSREHIVPHCQTIQAIIAASGGGINVQDLVRLDQLTKKEP